MSFSSEKKKKKSKKQQGDSDMNESFQNEYLKSIDEKKKKKNKKQLLANSDTMLNDSYLNNSMESIDKKKKKTDEEGQKNKKRRKSSISSSVDENTDTTIEEGSPKKKKKVAEQVLASPKTPKKSKSGSKKKFALVGNETPMTASSAPIMNIESQWSKAEEMELIEKVRLSLDSEDTLAYKVSIKHIKWEDMTVGNHSATECAEVMEKLIHKITKLKSLGMILQELSEGVPSTSRHRLSCKDKFVLDFSKKNIKKSSAIKLRDEAIAVWNNLSKEKRKIYEDDYAKEIEQSGSNRYLPDPPVKPFEIYYKEQLSTSEPASIFSFRSECTKQFYSEMPMKKKAKYIKECCKHWADYIKQFQKHLELHPNSIAKIEKLTSKDLIKEYMEYVGMPVKHGNAVGVFKLDLIKQKKLPDVDSQNQLRMISKMYADLPGDMKEKYRVKSKELEKELVGKFQAWKEKVGEDIALVADTYFLKIKKPGKSAGRKSRKNTKITFTNILKVDMAKPKLPNEPERPPLNARRIFEIKFEKKRREKYSNKDEMKKACSAAWNQLDKDAKQKYEERDKENKVLFKESLLEYVRSIGNLNKVFLGFKRKEFSSYFKEDIFEKEFPNKDYPIYEIVSKTQVNKTPVKAEQSNSSAEEEEDDDEEEEEDDDDEDDANQTTVKDEDSSEEEEAVTKAWHTPQHGAANDDSSDEEDESSED